MILLDSKTTYLVGAAFVAVTGLNLFLMALRLPATQRASGVAWALASVSLAASWTLFAFGDLLPEITTVLFGNLLYLAAVTLIYQSVRLFDGFRSSVWIYLAVPLVVAVNLGGRYLFDSLEFRVTLMSTAVAIPLLLAAHHLLGRRERLATPGFGRGITGAWLLANASVLLARAVATVATGSTAGVVEQGLLQTAILGISLATVAGLIFSYYLLVSGRAMAHLKSQAERDHLTGIVDRRAFELRAQRELDLATARARPLALLLIDANDFKRINDTWGHDAGDEALQAISEILQENLRQQDILCRLGGDEFAVLLPTVSETQARRLSQRLRMAVDHHSLPSRRLSVSIGLTMLRPDQTELRSLLKSADEALYEDKRRSDPATTSEPVTVEGSSSAGGTRSLGG